MKTILSAKKLCVTAVVFLVLQLAAVRAEVKGKPNILFIITDQQRFDTISANVNNFGVKTPNLDALVARGVLFENAFCTSPICCPSRATLMTGLYPSKAGVPSNLAAPLNERVLTIAHRLQTIGYRTAYHGKSHLKGDLHHYGFEVAYENNHDLSTRIEASRFFRELDVDKDKRPFFNVVSFLDPHDIYFLDPDTTDKVTLPPWKNGKDTLENKPWPQTGKGLWEWNEERWQYYRRYYGERLVRVDREIGELMEEFRSTGLTENTWIVFTADHGDMGGEHGLPFKGPFMYEGVTHVPLLIVPPRVRTVSRTMEPDKKVFPFKSPVLTSSIDIVPTFMDIAGLAPDPGLPGKSLLPVVRREAFKEADAIFAEWHGQGNIVTPIRSIRTARWKYNLYLNIGEELYDLKNDPDELKNLAGDPASQEMRKELRQRLEEHLKREGDPFFSLKTSERAPSSTPPAKP